MGLQAICRNYVPILGASGNLKNKEVKKNNSVFEENQIAQKEEVTAEENNTKESSLWGKVKEWFKNPSNSIGAACAGAGIAIMSLVLLSSLNPVTISLALLGAITLLMGGCSIAQGYETEKQKKYDKKADEHLEKMKQEKLAEQNEEQLDSSKAKNVEKLYGEQQLVTFKTKNGAIATKVNVPLALKLNETLEKYSTKNSPEISIEEQNELLKETAELFKELKEKAQNSHMPINHAYSFGKYNINASLKVAEQKEAEFKELFEKYTQENSSNGKNIDKSELLDLREKMFTSINN